MLENEIEYSSSENLTIKLERYDAMHKEIRELSESNMMMQKFYEDIIRGLKKMGMVWYKPPTLAEIDPLILPIHQYEEIRTMTEYSEIKEYLKTIEQ